LIWSVASIKKGLMTMFRVVASSEDNDYDVSVYALDLPGDFQAVFSWQVNVHEDQMWAQVLNLAQGFLSIGCLIYINQWKAGEQDIRKCLSKADIFLNKKKRLVRLIKPFSRFPLHARKPVINSQART
jgi:hypothetical protein